MTRLRCLLPLVLLVIGLTALGAGRQAAAAEPYVFEIDMYGQNVVPPVKTDSWGFVRFFFNQDRSEADYTVDIKGVSYNLVTGADIRLGAPGVNGPIVHHLSDGNFIASGSHISFTPDDLLGMASGNWYVIFYTQMNPDGEIRGQILPPLGFLPQLATPGPPALPVVTCSFTSGGVGERASATFTWAPLRGGSLQWLDLSLDNSFAPGSFLGAGPLPPNTNQYTWSGLLTDLPHFWRINTLMPGGWASSRAGAFVPCGGPALIGATYICTGNGRADVSFFWAPGSPPSLQWFDLDQEGGVFAPGAYRSQGTLGGEQSQLTWNALAANQPYFWRANAYFGTAWQPTATGYLLPAC